MQARLKLGVSAFGPALVLGGALALAGCGSTAATANTEANPGGRVQACLIEGSVLMFGKAVPASDCLQGTGANQASLESVCQAALQAMARQVQDSGGEAPRLSHLQACPAGALATCEGYAGQPLTAHYYRRDAALLQATKDSCRAQGGQWKP
jgi:hypothetical protein